MFISGLPEIACRYLSRRIKRSRTLRTLAKTLTSWLELIIGMWRFSKTNGITEGFHNKMEMISRRAFGFRNFENYRLRVLTHCGWDGIINRVRVNARPPCMDSSSFARGLISGSRIDCSRVFGLIVVSVTLDLDGLFAR